MGLGVFALLLLLAGTVMGAVSYGLSWYSISMADKTAANKVTENSIADTDRLMRINWESSKPSEGQVLRQKFFITGYLRRELIRNGEVVERSDMSVPGSIAFNVRELMNRTGGLVIAGFVTGFISLVLFSSALFASRIGAPWGNVANLGAFVFAFTSFSMFVLAVGLFSQLDQKQCADLNERTATANGLAGLNNANCQQEARTFTGAAMDVSAPALSAEPVAKAWGSNSGWNVGLAAACSMFVAMLLIPFFKAGPFTTATAAPVVGGAYATSTAYPSTTSYA